MIDIDKETMVPLMEAKIPGNPCKATRFRWVLKGVGEPAIILESVVIGQQRWTSQEAVARWIAKTTASKATVSTVEASGPSRKKQTDAARRELAELGV